MAATRLNRTKTATSVKRRPSTSKVSQREMEFARGSGDATVGSYSYGVFTGASQYRTSEAPVLTSKSNPLYKKLRAITKI